MSSRDSMPPLIGLWTKFQRSTFCILSRSLRAKLRRPPGPYQYGLGCHTCDLRAACFIKLEATGRTMAVFRFSPRQGQLGGTAWSNKPHSRHNFFLLLSSASLNPLSVERLRFATYLYRPLPAGHPKASLLRTPAQLLLPKTQLD